MSRFLFFLLSVASWSEAAPAPGSFAEACRPYDPTAGLAAGAGRANHWPAQPPAGERPWGGRKTSYKNFLELFEGSPKTV